MMGGELVGFLGRLKGIGTAVAVCLAVCMPSSAVMAQQATAANALQAPPGFQIELLYSVPAEQYGSWVSMTADPLGRLIVCDQYGKLYRVTPAPLGTSSVELVEPIDIPLGEAQGLLYAFETLYVVVNRGRQYESGLYRVRDTNADDKFDHVELLKPLPGRGGEHGPHSIIMGPDGQSLLLVAGNNTQLPEGIESFRAPPHWGEDQLLKRAACSNGHNTGVMAPGGWVCRIDPTGKYWELVATGFRNPYDLAINREGEIFTFDADMEMDVGTPWYRPTRVCHVVSGAEFGWRYGTGKWPAYAVDSLPSVVDIGQGSPTGIAFGYDSTFPRRYREALFICDWTYGRMFAVHLQPQASSYTAEIEEFITGTPLPLTDVLINPLDRAMYFIIGGRRTQSGLYRVTWRPDRAQSRLTPPPRRPRAMELQAAQHRLLRQRLESLHAAPDPGMLPLIWENLADNDRHIRYAARIALEHLPVDLWQQQSLAERQPDAALGSLLALARTGTEEQAAEITTALISVARTPLSDRHWTDWLRVTAVHFARHGRPPESALRPLRELLEPRFPTTDRFLNHELCRMLVYLDSPAVIPAAIEQMRKAVEQEDFLAYAMSLRVARAGWTEARLREFLKLLNQAERKAASGDYIGGGHLQIYIQMMRKETTAGLNSALKTALADVLLVKLPSTVPTGSPTPRPFIRNWTQQDLLGDLDRVGRGRSFESGRKAFVSTFCAHCHRFNNIGGVLGPDLSSAARSYARPTLLREILDPSAQVSDQFQLDSVLTTGGKQFHGRIMERDEDGITIATNPLNPTAISRIPIAEIDEITQSKTSLMPAGLVNTLTRDEILDLIAYIESRGDPQHANFQP